MVDVDTLQSRWSSCAWAPVEFSPDGSKVYADALNASGPDLVFETGAAPSKPAYE